MSQFTSRPYSSLSDIALIVGFLRLFRLASLVTEYPSIHEIPGLLSLPQNQGTTRLWLKEDHIVGFAYVDGFHTLGWSMPL
jgi:hypothetical protein